MKTTASKDFHPILYEQYLLFHKLVDVSAVDLEFKTDFEHSDMQSLILNTQRHGATKQYSDGVHVFIFVHGLAGKLVRLIHM